MLSPFRLTEDLGMISPGELLAIELKFNGHWLVIGCRPVSVLWLGALLVSDGSEDASTSFTGQDVLEQTRMVAVVTGACSELGLENSRAISADLFERTEQLTGVAHPIG